MKFSARTLAIAVRLVAMCGTAGVVAFWLADRSPPVLRTDFGILNPQVGAGGNLELLMQVNRRRSCASRVERSIVDARTYRFVMEDADFSAAAGPLGDDSFIIRIPVSSGAATGAAKLRTTVLYYCNPLHHFWPITEQWELPFQIAATH